MTNGRVLFGCPADLGPLCGIGLRTGRPFVKCQKGRGLCFHRGYAAVFARLCGFGSPGIGPKTRSWWFPRRTMACFTPKPAGCSPGVDGTSQTDGCFSGALRILSPSVGSASERAVRLSSARKAGGCASPGVRCGFCSALWVLLQRCAGPRRRASAGAPFSLQACPSVPSTRPEEGPRARAQSRCLKHLI